MKKSINFKILFLSLFLLLASCSKEDVDLDPDNDGLVNSIAAMLGTDPFNSDTDGDGISDGDEDCNRNGVVDDDETDPNDANSDDDGIDDGEDNDDDDDDDEDENDDD